MRGVLLNTLKVLENVDTINQATLIQSLDLLWIRLHSFVYPSGVAEQGGGQGGLAPPPTFFGN